MDQSQIDRFTALSEPLFMNFGEDWWNDKRSLLFNEFKWVSEHDWRRVVGHVNKNVYNRYPKLGHFKAALDNLNIKKPEELRFVCYDCKGQRGFTVYLRERQTGVYCSAFRPCPTCVQPKMIERIGQQEWDDRSTRESDIFEQITMKEYFDPNRLSKEKVAQETKG